jgi:hypothetical protein
LIEQDMKHVILTLILGFSFNAFAQDSDAIEAVKKDFLDYYRLLAEQKIDSALDYSNPRLFEVIPRDQIKSLMEALYQMPDMEYKTGMPTFLKFEEVVEIDNMNYLKFYISSPAEMKFNSIESSDENVMRMTKNLEMRFGFGNVQFDKETGYYKINAEKTIIASSEKTLMGWQFVTVDNPKMKALLEQIIPAEVLN